MSGALEVKPVAPERAGGGRVVGNRTERPARNHRAHKDGIGVGATLRYRGPNSSLTAPQLIVWTGTVGMFQLVPS